MSLFLDAATKYASKGWVTFPLQTRDKVPIEREFQKIELPDSTQHKLWAQIYPDANIGIACGSSGLVVVDIDPKNGGSVDGLVGEFPELENHPYVVQTGSGGFHYYFKARPTLPLRNDQSGKVGTGIDVRAIGGYVVAPLSIHPNGAAYIWKRPSKSQSGIEMPFVPLDIVDKLLKAGPSSGSNAAAGEVDMIPAGERHGFFLSLAGAMRARGAGEEEMLASMRVTNEVRCDPPHEDSDLERIASDYAQKSVGEMKFGPKWVAEKPMQVAEKQKLSLISYSTIKEENIDWLWQDRIAKGRFNLLVGLPGQGKTYTACALAAYVSSGRPLPGTTLPMGVKPASVLMITYEDGYEDTLKPRLRKCGADMDRVFAVKPDQKSFNVEDIAMLSNTLEDYPEIEFIVIDPIQSMMGNTDDNNDTKLRVALDPFVRMLRTKKVALLGIKHLNKNEGASIENRIGGSIGWTGIARSILFAGHDREKPSLKGSDPGGPETYGGIIPIKGNLSGTINPYAYSINNNGFYFLGTDDTLTTERLLPKKPENKAKT